MPPSSRLARPPAAAGGRSQELQSLDELNSRRSIPFDGPRVSLVLLPGGHQTALLLKLSKEKKGWQLRQFSAGRPRQLAGSLFLFTAGEEMDNVGGKGREAQCAGNYHSSYVIFEILKGRLGGRCRQPAGSCRQPAGACRQKTASAGTPSACLKASKAGGLAERHKVSHSKSFYFLEKAYIITTLMNRAVHPLLHK